MTNNDAAALSPAAVPRVTSAELTVRAIRACWIIGSVLLLGGLVATFVRDNGAGTAALIAFGGVLILLALMKRVPLRFEVGSTKLDASYDEAFAAGQEQGTRRALEVAISEVEETKDEEETKTTPSNEEILRVLDQVSLSLNERLVSMPSIRVGGGGGADFYPTRTAVAAAGITERQIDYWARTGLVEPSTRTQTGDAFYTERDLVILSVVKRLLDTGVSLQQIRHAVSDMQDRSLAELAQVTLMSDGVRTYEASSSDEVIELVHSGQGVFGISVGRVAQEVRKRLGADPGTARGSDGKPQSAT